MAPQAKEIRSTPWNSHLPAMAVSMAIVFVLAGCEIEQAASAAVPAPPQIPVASPLLRNVPLERQYPARVEAIERVELRPRVSGYVDSVLFEDGAIVEQGQVLFRIDARPYRAALAAAEAELALANSDLALARQEADRSLKLVERRAIAEQELERRLAALTAADARVGAAQASLELAALELSFTEIQAPFRGRIGRTEVTAGNLVSSVPGESSLLATLVSLETLYLTFDIDDRTAIAAGSSGENLLPVEFRLPGLNEAIHSKVTFLDNELGEATGTLRVRARIPNPGGRLIPGMVGHVSLAIGGERWSLLVDDKAIGTDQGRRYVLLAGDTGAVEYRQIETGQLHSGLRVVSSGLDPDDRVIVNGLMSLRPGAVISPVDVSMEQAAAGIYVPVEPSLIASQE